jgi:hypothetical protein
VESARAKREMFLNCLSMVVDGREVDDGDSVQSVRVGLKEKGKMSLN